jgi:peptide/nickel transport system ATP-binding protein
MHLGRVVELAEASQVFGDPRHPYTRALLASVPSGDPGQRRGAAPLAGEPPSPVSPPTGCRFHTRCPLLAVSPDARCASEDPVLRGIPERRAVACHQA